MGSELHEPPARSDDRVVGSAAARPSEPDARGAWRSYWYNDAIYETNITEGLNVFRLKSRAVADARQVPFLNPQTQVGPTSAQG